MENNEQMYKNINSVYILRHIFSFIETRTSLNIIYRCKNIMKKLEITLDDYEKKSGKIIIKKKDPFDLSLSFEKNYKDYVYIQDTDILLFKGYYKNGKKNGKGTEFYKNKKKKFEGEYLNGVKINGTGYDKFGNVIYQIKDKQIIEKYINGLIVFKGEYLNGKKYKGVGYDISGNQVYKINYGKGKVKEFFDDGVLKFEGEYFNGERNGQGIRYDYEGEILFEGIYLNGEKWTGKGKEYYTDHDQEDDTNNNPFKNYDFFGVNKPKQNNYGFNNFYNYGFNNFYGFNKPKQKNYGLNDFFGLNKKNKNLTRVKVKGLGLSLGLSDDEEKKILKYEGEYLNGQRHGKGKEYNKYGDLIYEGDYLNGKKHGQGKEYYDQGSLRTYRPMLQYEGEFKDGLYDGKGILYNVGIVSSGIEHQGIFEKGKFIEYMKLN